MCVQVTPGNQDVPVDATEAMNEPDIQVNGKRAAFYLNDGLMGEWHRMLAQALEELRCQFHCRRPEQSLIRIVPFPEIQLLDNRSVRNYAVSRSIRFRPHQRKAGEPQSLRLLVGLTDRAFLSPSDMLNADRPHPLGKAAAHADDGLLRSDGLGLKIHQQQACTGAVRDTNPLQRSAWSLEDARNDGQGNSPILTGPRVHVSNGLLCRQGHHAHRRMQKARICPIVAHHGAGDLNPAALRPVSSELCGLLDTELLDLLLHQAAVLKVVNAAQASVGLGWSG